MRGAMPVFYLVWAVVCLLAFITSSLLGCITIALGVMVRLLELNNQLLTKLLEEQRAQRRETRLAALQQTPES